VVFCFDLRMIQARAGATVPASADEVFSVATDLDNATWLPAVRGLHRIAGSPDGIGARYDVEVGLVGRHLHGVLVCRELDPPRNAVFALENGMDLTIKVSVSDVPGGAGLELVAEYSVGGGPFSAAMERATGGAARREVARAVEQLAARFGRKAGRGTAG
jgi:carbon monoxide dehydrogenase subunit G